MGTITLPNFRVSADVKMNTRLKDGGVYIDWNSLTDIKVWLFSNDQKARAGRCDVSIDETDGTKLVCRYSASKPQYLGVNKIIVQATYQGATKTYDKPVFNFVRWTADQAGEEITIDDPEVDVEIVAEDISSSILDEATAAALAAAENANEAAGNAGDAAEAALAAKGAAENAATAATNAATLASIAVDNCEEATRQANTAASSAFSAAGTAREAADEADTAKDAALEAAAAAAQASDIAGADHTRAEGDHSTAVSDHSTASSDHTTAQSDHTTAGADHTRAETDHSTAASDHTASGTATAAATAAAALATEKAALVQDKLDMADTDHTRAESDHATAVSDHGIAGTDHTTATGDHTTASADHTLAGADHTTAASDHTTAGSDHTLAASDHTTAGADHTQALADHEVMEGYDNRLDAVEGDVTELEAKVDEKWKLDDSPVDISTFKNGYISTNGNYSTVVNASSGTKCRNFDVSPGQVYKLYGTSASSGWYRLWAVFAADGTRISICPSGDYTATPAEVTIPANGVHMTVNLYNYSAETDKVLLVGKVVDAATLQAEIEGNSFDIDVVKKQADFSMENEMRSNPFSPILIDWMQLCHAKNGMTSVEQMSVVSATENALTLSSSDASAFASPSPAVVGFSDGSYKVVYFQASSGTTVERRDFETTDLTNAVTVQSLHDTVSGGYGIHLSAGGYLALGQFTAEELTKRESQKDSNLITGANFYYCPPASNPSNIVDAGGREICKIAGTFDGNGQIPGGIIAGWSIPSSENQMFGYSSGWINKCFQFDQNGNGKYLDLDFPCSGKGFVEIQCALLQYNTYFTGTAKMEVFADDTLLATYSLVYNQTMYRVDANVKRNLRIRFTLTSASSTYCLLYSVNFWRMPSFVPIPSFAGTKIAVLGDSWTQFPGPGAELEDHPDFNVLVTRPDGSEGGNGGYGYFPKELARVLNATVDNWGNGGKTAGNWGVPEIDTVLAFTDYDYVLIEFFINDFNAGDPIDKWVRNLKIICNRCIARGVRPIVIVPCLTNSAGLAGGSWHEYIMRGLMELP